MTAKRVFGEDEEAWRVRLIRDLGVGFRIRSLTIVLVVILAALVVRLTNSSYDMLPLLVGDAIVLFLYLPYRLWFRTEWSLQGLMWLTLGVDLATATVGVYLTGGIESPMVWLYLVVLLSWGHLRGWKMGTAAGIASCLLLYLVVGLNYFDILPHFPLLPLGRHFYQDGGLVVSLSLLYSGMLILVGLFSAYAVSLVGRERRHSGYVSGVQALVTVVEAKDPHTRGHSERVAEYAVAIAQELGYKSKETARLRDAALLHDVGRISLPDDVVSNQGTLTPVQQSAMMSHPLLSYEVLERAGTMADLLPAVRHHHEWYGGGGYPDGLSGEDIPLDARILAVADAFAAMTAGRRYRPRLSPDHAAQELISGRGTQFDPQVVDAFLNKMRARAIPLPGRVAEPVPVADDGTHEPLASRQLPWTLGMITPTQHKASTFLFRLGQEVRSVLDLTALLERILSLLEETQNYLNCTIFLKVQTGGLLTAAAIGYRAAVKGAIIPAGAGIIDWVSQHNEVRLIPDVAVDPAYQKDSFPKVGSMLVAPLLTEGRTTGVLLVENEMVDAFTQEDALLVEIIGPYIAAVVEVAQLHRQAKEAAFYDGLTGVHNHRYFYERLDEELARSARYASPITIGIIDVDGLKGINDTYGHLAGDQTLREIGQVLKANVRASDVVARYGGDEFAIIMPQTSKEEAERLMSRIANLLDTRIVCHGGESFPMPSRSCGLATYPEDGKQPTELFDVADDGLYQGKRRKSNSGRPAASQTAPEEDRLADS